MFENKINNFQNNTFDIVRSVTWILYLLILFGLTASAPQYLDDLNYYVQIYVSLFLIYRFNPFRQVKFNELDVKIAFAAGIFILFTTTIGDIIKTYIGSVKQYIKLLEYEI
jgi:hypothetical protein